MYAKRIIAVFALVSVILSTTACQNKLKDES